MKTNLKVCPDCGSIPWYFHNPGANQENQPEFCQDCGTKIIPRSELPRDIWKDPAVRCALKEGRSAYDIWVIGCPKCNQFGYYNQGSSFSCRFCDKTWRVTDDDFDPVTLSDTVTVTIDSYHNETLADS